MNKDFEILTEDLRALGLRSGDSVLLVHSTHARQVGTRVKLYVAPEDIQVMHKSDCSPDVLKKHADRAK